jgi:hypothetical protein
MNVQGLPSTMLGAAVPASSARSAGSSSSTPSTTQNNSAEQTFIKLLVTELQSQDPTQPMDPTQMVGQMFQMNQLQQLIDINQTLSTALGIPPSGASSSGATATPAASTHSNLGTSLLQAAISPTSAAASYAQQLLTGAH